MRLPRRVPWSSLAELEQLCAAIYSDEHDLDSKIFAINRISAWKAITSLPQALESTLAILVVIVHDKKEMYLSTLLLRQSYASAILRLVNGLVDPLQAGTYARPITAIAQQLGLPNWLVELRHAATHEDLPSVDLLREAARQSMSWLLHNYFLPTINPVSNEQQQLSNSARPLLPMLKLYKNTMKIITRDASLMSQYKVKLVHIMKELERWIAETKVVANISSGEIGWMNQNSLDVTSSDSDAKEIWALERICDGLAEKGCLVPLSKKKRQPCLDSFLPGKASIALWEPLLKHIQAIHPDFPYVLCRRLSTILLECNSNETPGIPDVKRDLSYEEYIACWVNWTIETLRDDLSAYLDMKRVVLSVLLKGLGYDSTSLSKRSAILVLLKRISAGQPELGSMINFLVNPLPQTSPSWDSGDLEVMKKRHEILMSHQPSEAPYPFTHVDEAQSEFFDISIPGWHTMENSTWKPCPIGVYIDTR